MIINIFKIKKIKTYLFIFLILANLSVILYLRQEIVDSNFLKIVFFDVGQGDAILIKIPGGYKILVDAGSGKNIINKINKELPFYDKKIDLIIPTHPDSDHIGGFLNLIDNISINSAIIGGNFSQTQSYRTLLEKLKQNKIKILKALIGGEIKIGDKAKLEIINPTQDISFKNQPDENNYATSFILTYQQRKFLFTSDIEKKAEKELIEKIKDKLNIDVLKVAHHGSKTSSSKEFINITSPGISIIQVGKNNQYGHPHLQTLENLKPSLIFRNDEKGDIVLYSDGQTIWIR